MPNTPETRPTKSNAAATAILSGGMRVSDVRWVRAARGQIGGRGVDKLYLVLGKKWKVIDKQCEYCIVE